MHHCNACQRLLPERDFPDLWTNPGDVVLSPFMGIGSEGYVALEMGRRFVGVELKASYYGQATRNLEHALAQASLFSTEVVRPRGVEQAP